MLYMVIERFGEDRAADIYRRLRDRGRMAPEGVLFIASWVDVDFQTCYQVMEAESDAKLREWMANWSDLVEFETVPVHTSEAAARLIAPSL